MKVIKIGDCRVSVGLCNLRCPYCVHLHEKTENMNVNEIVKRLEDCKSVYIGGAEPTVYGDLLDLLQELSKKGIEVTLKTDGLLPEKIMDSLPFVSKFVFEIKGDFEDIGSVMTLSGLNEKRAKKYAQNLLKSIKIAKKNKKKIRIWFRVIPEYIDEKRFRKMMEKIGKVDEILLYQFLSRADWDRAVEGFEKPEISFVKRLKEVAEEYADRVIVVGDGER